MNKLSWIRGATILMLLLSFQATAQDDSLVSVLTDELGVSSAQASGGAGAIFEYAKDNLDADDFATIAKGIPEMDSLLDAAPEVDRDSRFGRASSRLRDFDSSLGDLAGLAASFEELDMYPEMLENFLSVVNDYVDSESGERAAELLDDLF